MFDMRAYVARMVIVLLPILVGVFFLVTSWGWITVVSLAFVSSLMISGLMGLLAHISLRDERRSDDI